ncbi:peptidylprolyl isomerase [bacterium]|nr:peptidylprolyl isomerase [bacterium]
MIYCSKAEKREEPKQEPLPPPTVTKAEPGPFGITRHLWDATATPQDRIEVALAVKDEDIELQGNEKATIETNKGAIVVKLYSKDAPNTVRNFIRLAESGFYDGLIWHRYEPGFVLQGGDPLGNGSGNAGYNIDFEPNPKKHVTGAMCMARGPAKNSASCQFYICLADKPHLDGNYVVFAKTVECMDVVNELRRGDTIVKITISRD